MTIPAKYENGVFRPLEDVELREGTPVEVHVTTPSVRKPKSIRELGICGMWADRNDITDGVTYEDKLRHPRAQ